MFALIQIVIDVVLALGLIIALAAHVAHRSLHEEWDVFRQVVEGWMTKTDSKFDGGTEPK